MADPTYPLDRRILEIIMELTGTTQQVNLGAVEKASGAVFKTISTKIADAVWEQETNPDVDRSKVPFYNPLHINTWKAVFGHNNLHATKSPSKDTIKQLTLFLDYDSWDDLMKDLKDRHHRVVVEHQIHRNRNISMQIAQHDFNNMKPGEQLEVSWPPSKGRDKKEGDAFIRITFEGGGRFIINTARNCSLEAGETFEIVCLEEGQKLILNNRMRNNRPIADKVYLGGNPVVKIKKLK